MAKPAKSQWEFEFSAAQAAPTRQVVTVSELTGNIRRFLEQTFGRIWVSGEITNLRNQTSGHFYFSLKDATAQISCVLFRGEMQVDRSLLQDGKKVTIQGELTVYEPRGQYQLRVLRVELEGLGALQVAFERLKQRLQQEGFFAPERKRPLPAFPRRIGIVTSRVGAALQDILHVVRRRNPTLQIVLASCRVQGDGAGDEIACAIRLLNEYHQSSISRDTESGLDLILLARGGGSLEDLWAFNEEVVAREIFNSALPVVSAIGHEIDFTISDFVADLRAATPSAAAEILTEGVFSSCQFFSRAGERIQLLALRRLAGKTENLQGFGARLARLHPRRLMETWSQKLDDLQTSIGRCALQGMRERKVGLTHLAERLGRVRPAVLIRQRRAVLHQETERLHEQASHHLKLYRNRIEGLESRLRLLGPEHVLARGYSITEDAETGKILRSAEKTKPGRQIRTRLGKGTLISEIKTIEVSKDSAEN
jgi:exodeoxyribonuclease VII large subunit